MTFVLIYSISKHRMIYDYVCFRFTLVDNGKWLKSPNKSRLYHDVIFFYLNEKDSYTLRRVHFPVLTCLLVGVGVCGLGYNVSCEVKPESCDETLESRIVPGAIV